MGGYGSTRWGRHSRKITIENCLTLEIGRLIRAGIAQDHRCGWEWGGGEATRSIGYEWEAGKKGSDLVLRLLYRIRGVDGWVNVDESVIVERTAPNYGGNRYWFRCPLIVNGRACRRRVTKIHLPPGGRFFGCRHCYRLTHQSAQTHDKRVDALRRNSDLLISLRDGLSDSKTDSRWVQKAGLYLRATGGY